MKKRISMTLTILGLALGLGLFRLWMPASTTGDPLLALQGEAALNHLKDQGLYGSLREAVTAARPTPRFFRPGPPAVMTSASPPASFLRV